MNDRDVIGTGKAAITQRQFEAFRLVFTEGLSYLEAARKMGISQQAVSKLIKKIKEKYPECVPNTKVATEAWRHKVSYNPELHDHQIKEKW